MIAAEQLVSHIKRFTAIHEREIPLIRDHFVEQQTTKKEILTGAGRPCNHHYFVVNGCLRMFFINEKGQDQTVQFAIENWWLTDHAAFSTKGRAGFSIQAVEASTLMTIDLAKQESLFKAVPAMERYFRIIYQKAYAASQLKMKYRSDRSGEETYLNFRESFPGFVERVPQNMLASYLGITPEYLSMVKKRNA